MTSGGWAFINRTAAVRPAAVIRSALRSRAFASKHEEVDYLAVHRPNLYWFPSKEASKENDGREIGPYPSTPDGSDWRHSAQFRPANHADYFDRQNRRRFGEVVPEQAEVQGMWNVDIEGDYSLVYMLSGLVVFFGTVGGIVYFFGGREHDDKKTWRRFAVDKDAPNLGLQGK